MPLDHDQIVAISQDVIERYPQPLEFVGVMRPKAAAETELRRKLQASLRAHVPTTDNRKFRHAVVCSHLSGGLDRLRVAGRWD